MNSKKMHDSVEMVCQDPSSHSLDQFVTHKATEVKEMKKNVTGTEDADVSTRLLCLCACASGIGTIEGDKTSEAKNIFTITSEMKPQDAIEGMLVTKLIALHEQGMNLLARSTGDVAREAKELYVNLSTKLLRLFNETLETLIRYRRRGEQRVIVQHVNVGDGGKAVVGNLLGGGMNEKIGVLPNG